MYPHCECTLFWSNQPFPHPPLFNSSVVVVNYFEGPTVLLCPFHFPSRLDVYKRKIIRFLLCGPLKFFSAS
jgi:hypothetical protein